jgi:hypothetical protein
MEEKMNSLNKTARGAGILYIIMDVFMIFGGMYVYSKIYVPGDAMATVSNILASEWLFRLGFVSLLVGLILQLYLVHVLYELFKSVEKGQANMMVILIVAGVSLSFMNMLIQYAPILLLSNAGHLSAFNPTQLQTLSMVSLDMYEYGLLITEIFWGLWLIPLGILVYKSGFVPKVLGVLLIVGCFGHLIIFVSTFMFPDFSKILTPIGETVTIGELPIFLWLLIKGAKSQKPALESVS